jgi:uncharacterized protein YkwD
MNATYYYQSARRKMLPTRHHASLSLQSIPEDDWLTYDDFRNSDSTYSSCAPLPRYRTMKSLTALNRSEVVQLIEHERSVRGLHAFRTSEALNQLATQQACAMAKIGIVFHTVATIEELQLFLSSRQVAENIQRGDNASEMHKETMASVATINRSNLLSPYFTEFGCGVALGRDGKLYCCQLFRN